MPTNFIKHLHKMTNVPTSKIEQEWSKAENKAIQESHKKPIGNKYAYATSILENMMHVKSKHHK